MLSTGEPNLDEMACLENLSCGTLDITELSVYFQVLPVAVQNRESRQRQSGRYVLYIGVCQDSSSSTPAGNEGILSETNQKEGLSSTDRKSAM